jgi:MFS family permease
VSGLRARFAGGWHSTFRSLGVRNFRLFFTGQLISQVGNWLTLIAQTLLVLKLTNSGLAVGLLAATQFGPVLILGPFAGLIADRSDKRKLLLMVQSLAMVESFCLAVFAFLPHPPLAGIYLTALFGGVTVAFDNPARRAFVVEMVENDDVHNAVSLNSALMTSSRIVGPALAGLLITTVGYGWCFTVDGVSYLAVLYALWRMNPAELRPPPVAQRGRGQVREGLRYVRRVPDLWVPLVVMAVIGTLTFNFQVVIPLLVKRTFHGTDGTFTLVYAVLSLGSFVGALASARRKTISVRQIVVSAGLFGVADCLFAVAPGLSLLFPMALLVGVSSISFMTASTTMVQVRASPDMRGRVLALQAMVFLGSTPIGGPIMGGLSDRYGPRAALLVGGAAAVLAAGWGFMMQRRISLRVAATPTEPVVETLQTA